MVPLARGPRTTTNWGLETRFFFGKIKKKLAQNDVSTLDELTRDLGRRRLDDEVNDPYSSLLSTVRSFIFSRAYLKAP